MSHLEELVFSVVYRSNGISAYMATMEINREFDNCINRKQVSGALQRLRARWRVKHFGAWTAIGKEKP